MRLIILLYFTIFSFFVVFAENPHQEKGLQEIIAKQKIKCIQDKLKSGVPEYGVPSFAPLNLDDVINIDMDKLNIPYVSGNFHLEKINLEGIVEWTITDMKVNILIGKKKIMAELNFPSILFESKSLTDLTILIMKLSGNNAAKLSINNVFLKIDMEQIADTEGILWWKPKITARSDDFLFTLNELLLNGKDIAPTVSQFLNSLPTYKDNIIGVLEYVAHLYLNADKLDDAMLEKIVSDVIGFVQNVLKIISIDIQDKVLDFDLVPLITGKVDIKEFNLNGIDDWTLGKVTVKRSSPKKYAINFNFPNINLKSDTLMDLNILDIIKVSGASLATLKVTEFDFDAVLEEFQFEDKLWLTPIITSKIKDFEFDLNELLINGEDISPMINAIVQSIPIYIEDINLILEYIIMTLLNDDTEQLVSTYGLIDIIQIINGIKQILAECI